MRFFIAGIMQGSHSNTDLHDQDYRTMIREAILDQFPEADVYDPYSNHTSSVSYSDDQGSAVFYNHNQMCGEVDVLVAYIPQASMGTAIEMWEAYRNNRTVIAISPLEHNWAIKYSSHAIYVDLESFLTSTQAGAIQQLLAKGNK